MNQNEYIAFHNDLCDEAEGLKLRQYGQYGIDKTNFKLSEAFKGLCESIQEKDADSVDYYAQSLIHLAVQNAVPRCTSGPYEAFCERGRQLSLRKNNDYASPEGQEDRFAIFKNFLRCEQLGVCSVEAGFLVRLSDKVSRCENLMERTAGPSVVDEKLEDTLLDIVNYTCLLMAYLKVKGDE